MGLDFRYTGFPRGHAAKVTNAASTITAAAGNKLFVMAISSTDGGTSAWEFPTAVDGIGDIKLATKATLSFPIPIECTSFANPNTNCSTIYFEIAKD